MMWVGHLHDPTEAALEGKECVDDLVGTRYRPSILVVVSLKCQCQIPGVEKEVNMTGSRAPWSLVLPLLTWV